MLCSVGGECTQFLFPSKYVQLYKKNPSSLGAIILPPQHNTKSCVWARMCSSICGMCLREAVQCRSSPRGNLYYICPTHEQQLTSFQTNQLGKFLSSNIDRNPPLADGPQRCFLCMRLKTQIPHMQIHQCVDRCRCFLNQFEQRHANWTNNTEIITLVRVCDVSPISMPRYHAAEKCNRND